MTTSASTPRLRLTLLWYLLLVAATAVNRPVAWSPALSMALDALALSGVAVALLGRIWCSVFIAGRKDSELVVTGPYSACRHPLYVLSVIGGAGLGFATHSATLATCTVLLLCALFSTAARAEESLLAARHPDAFAAYAATTPRFWPRPGLYRVPPTCEVRPPVLWKAFVDAGAFLLLLLLVLAARQLRAAAGWPGWLALP